MFDYFEDGEANFVNLNVRSSYRNDHILQTYKEMNLNYTIQIQRALFINLSKCKRMLHD